MWICFSQLRIESWIPCGSGEAISRWLLALSCSVQKQKVVVNRAEMWPERRIFDQIYISVQVPQNRHPFIHYYSFSQLLLAFPASNDLN